MMHARASWLLISAVLMLVNVVALPAQADPVADFYKGKTVNMIIGGSEGGGYDTLGRAIGRHMGKHIPGNPTIVARTMPGAGGMLAMNYLYNTAAKDGTVIGV